MSALHPDRGTFRCPPRPRPFDEWRKTARAQHRGPVVPANSTALYPVRWGGGFKTTVPRSALQPWSLQTTSLQKQVIVLASVTNHVWYVFLSHRTRVISITHPQSNIRSRMSLCFCVRFFRQGKCYSVLMSSFISYCLHNFQRRGLFSQYSEDYFPSWILVVVPQAPALGTSFTFYALQFDVSSPSHN